jgi:hypothetical protein
MNNEEIVLRGRLDGKQRNRLAILLDMEYTPSELANEIGFTQRQVYRVYIPLGCPHRKDDRRHIWINGKKFRSWVLNIYKKRELGLNEAFCLTCKKPVQMKNKTRKRSGRLFYYLCICPNCGRKLVRFITRGKPINDQSQ